MAERARVWYQPLTHYDAAAASKHLQAAALPALQQVHDHLAGMREWSPAAIHDALEACAKSLDLGLGKVAQPLRVAITGSQVSPSIDHTIYLAGRSEALNRIDAALARIRDGAA